MSSMSTGNMIKDSVERLFCERVDKAVLEQAEAGQWAGGLWRLVEEGGYGRMLCADAGDRDGEAPWLNAYPVFHAIGFHRVPLPLAETMIANGLLALAGLPAQDGPLTLLQQEQDGALALGIEGGRLLVTGQAVSVPWARFAQAIVVAGRAGTQAVVALVAAGTPGLVIEPAQNIGGEPRDRVAFQAVPCARYAPCPQDAPEPPATLFGALARAAQMVGAVRSALEQSVDYANQRVQFGRPIGRHQAIQQALAILAGELACAETAVMAACQSAALLPSAFDVAVAKIRAGRAAASAANIAHEVHGAFGFSHEHTLHYATRRLWSWRAEYGSEAAWAAQLGRQAISAGGEQFWRGLTAPR